MADYLKWVANQDCFIAGNKFVKKGEIILAPVTPNAALFSALVGDRRKPFAGFEQDLDGTLYHNSNEWNDFRFPITSTKQGANSKPDYDFTNMGYLFPQNDASEILYLTDQFSHSIRIGSLLHPHIHYIQAAAEVPVFKMDYRIIEIGGTVPAFATISSTGHRLTYVSGSIQQIIDFAPIAGPAGMSALIEIKLYRDDDVVSGDVLVKAFDLHVQTDSFGSGQEYTK